MVGGGSGRFWAECSSSSFLKQVLLVNVHKRKSADFDSFNESIVLSRVRSEKQVMKELDLISCEGGTPAAAGQDWRGASCACSLPFFTRAYPALTTHLVSSPDSCGAWPAGFGVLLVRLLMAYRRNAGKYCECACGFWPRKEGPKNALTNALRRRFALVCSTGEA